MEYKIGDKVIFINKEKHRQHPEYYPSINTVGTIVYSSKRTDLIRIQWPKYSTSDDDMWLCNPNWILPYNSSDKRIVDIQPYLAILEHDIQELRRLGLYASIDVLKSVIQDIKELPVLES